MADSRTTPSFFDFARQEMLFNRGSACYRKSRSVVTPVPILFQKTKTLFRFLETRLILPQITLSIRLPPEHQKNIPIFSELGQVRVGLGDWLLSPQHWHVPHQCECGFLNNHQAQCEINLRIEVLKTENVSFSFLSNFTNSRLVGLFSAQAVIATQWLFLKSGNIIGILVLI